MATRVETTGRMEGGKLLMRNRARFALELSRLRDGEVCIFVERKHAIRSLQANAYYWGVIVAMFSDYTGYTSEEMHEFFKRHFLPEDHRRQDLVIVNTNGEEVETFSQAALTTTRLNKVQFYEYCERIRAWAEQDVLFLIPTPQDADEAIAADYERTFQGRTEPAQLTDGAPTA